MRSKLLSLLFVIFIWGNSAWINALNSFNAKPFVVVLDAGHGGKDPGNLGNGFKEKDIVLDVVLQMGKILEKTAGSRSYIPVQPTPSWNYTNVPPLPTV